jgi:hypothetical protein
VRHLSELFSGKFIRPLSEDRLHSDEIPRLRGDHRVCLFFISFHLPDFAVLFPSALKAWSGFSAPLSTTGKMEEPYRSLASVSEGIFRWTQSGEAGSAKDCALKKSNQLVQCPCEATGGVGRAATGAELAAGEDATW